MRIYSTTVPCVRPARRWRYALLVDDIEVDGFHCESYGVTVEDGESGHRRSVHHVTVNARKALELLDTLARCHVTPTTLGDVIEDWLAQ